MATSISDHPAAAPAPPSAKKGDGTGLMVGAGLVGLAGAGYLLWRHSHHPAPVPIVTPPPAPTPAPGPAPASHQCIAVVMPIVMQSRLAQPSLWRNWSDLRPLPLDGGACGPNRGGPTACVGNPPGTIMLWTMAKVGPDGRWYCRILTGSGAQGDWALPADDLTGGLQGISNGIATGACVGVS